MTTALLFAPEQPSTWMVWFFWAFLCVFAFPSHASITDGENAKPIPYVSWAQVEAKYDPTCELEFEGFIDKVRVFRFYNSGPVLGAEISQGEKTTLVLIAPMSFLASKGRLVGSRLRIKGVGSSQPMPFGELIIAREVTLQGRPLKLRDKAGKQVWSSKRAGQPIPKNGK